MKVSDVFKLILLHILAAITGFVLFAAFFSTPVFQSIDVFFYRGIALALLTALIIGCLLLILKFTARSWKNRLAIRDVLLSACVIVSLNTLFFTHVPVTADRSISIFVLGAMAEEPGRVFTEKEIEDFFIRRYVIDYSAFEKRFHEQAATGTIEQRGDGYIITGRGLLLIRFYDLVANCFHIDKKLIYPGNL